MVALIKRNDVARNGLEPIVSPYQTIKEISLQELVTRYQGFQGEQCLIFPVWERSPLFQRRLQTCINYVKQGDHILLHVLDGCSVMSPTMQQQAEKMGYDVGQCSRKISEYSSVWNEILFGDFEELIAYKDSLNEHFLFPNKEIAQCYVATHKEVEIRGKGVENAFDMIVYEIWKHKVDIGQG